MPIGILVAAVVALIIGTLIAVASVAVLKRRHGRTFQHPGRVTFAIAVASACLAFLAFYIKES